ncbi:DinB family protein [Paraflavitalea pollutisoli]|uniref:DinB family protein n=1 Tax=Paraflavitalea pollutisoli TaxID=3034143 RepID=UPI0023ED3D5C|nr:DinB family protein [Paraflavitalea sp. H1-2-19X]
MAVEQVVIGLTAHINNIPFRYSEIDHEVLLERPAPGKWSRKEILGHLIDSAINNLKRFVDVQAQPQPYTIQSYRQDDLVIINRYQDLPLDHLLHVWKSLNQQIVYVISAIPADKLAYQVITSAGEHQTLEWLVIDYLDHMEHHWRQVFGE